MLVYFGRPWNETFWCILLSSAISCPLIFLFVFIRYFCCHLVYFVVIWYILLSFGIFCCHLVYFVVIWYMYFVVIWYILLSFGIFCYHLVYFLLSFGINFSVFLYILWRFGNFSRFGILYQTNLATLLSRKRRHGSWQTQQAEEIMTCWKNVRYWAKCRFFETFTFLRQGSMLRFFNIFAEKLAKKSAFFVPNTVT
jgi:hypothetical protein